jgi:molecular chaperone GrpE (heat shock protein)
MNGRPRSQGGAAREQRAREIEQIREQLRDERQVNEALRRNVAEYKTQCQTYADDQGRLAAELKATGAELAREREVAAVARRAVAQLRDLVEVLDGIDPDPELLPDGQVRKTWERSAG